jgi:hypothetical protein
MAERDQPKGRTDEPDTKATHGRRTLHHVSDLRQAWSYGKLGPDDLVSIIDTDMLPISEIEELYAGHDMVFYTQQPDAVAGRTKDSQWWIDSDNRLTEEVCGGAVYRHQLYDFASDTISIHQKYDYHGKFVDTLHIYDKVTVDQPDRDGALARGRCLIFFDTPIQDDELVPLGTGPSVLEFGAHRCASSNAHGGRRKDSLWRWRHHHRFV